MSDDVAEVNEILKRQVRGAAEHAYPGVLKDRLQEWTPWTEAAWHLGVLFGMWPEGDGYKAFCEKRGVWWHNGSIGNMLYDCLDSLYKGGYLERHQPTDDYEFRWGVVTR